MPAQEHAAPFGPEAVARAASEARPLVEEIAGRTFSAPPEVVSIDREGLREVLARDRASAGLPEMGDLDRAILAIEAETTAAKYSFSGKKVYFCRENVEAGYAKGGFPAGREGDYLFLLVGHELVHALDDLTFDLAGAVGRAGERDALLALQALVEGHAIYVEWELARRRDAQDLFEKREAMIREVDPASPLPAILHEALVKEVVFPYVEGRAFVDWVVLHKGRAALEGVFRSPPRTTGEILAPARYFDAGPEEGGPDIERFIDLVEKELGGEGWEPSRADLGARDLALGLSDLPEETRRPIVEGFVRGRQLELASKASPLLERVTAAALLFDSPEAAGAMLAAGEELDRMKDEKIAQAGNPAMVVRESVRSELALPEGAKGSARLRRVLLFGSDQRIYSATFARGPVMIEIAATNLPAVEEKTPAVLERLANAIGEK